MSDFNGDWIRLLAPVVATGRAALHELDDREVPAGLRRVAASQGGGLPPPLARRLLAEIDANEWLREKVAEKWEGADDDPATLFLNRPDGWWVELAARLEAVRNSTAASRVAELEQRLQDLEAKCRKEARRAKAATRAAAATRADVDARVDEARQGPLERLAKADRRAAEARERQGAAEAKLLAEIERRRQAEGAFGSLRARFLRSRRRRGQKAGSSTRQSATGLSPLELARMLDRQAAAFGRDTPSESPEIAASPERIALPVGVAPDRPGAISWLLELDRPVTLVVDGYNALFHIDPEDFMSGAARRRLVDGLRRLRRRAESPHRVVIVFDSTLPGERSDAPAVDGVEVRFAPDDRIADDEIVDLAGEVERPVIISSDREVRDLAEEEGALVLWSEALAAWMRKR